jgi:hypothetical protein
VPLARARSLLCTVLLIALWLLPRPSAQAAMLVHLDLTSLALESDAIVLARITSSRHEGYRHLRTHVIVESYVGEFTPGDTIELDYGSIRLAPAHVDQDTSLDDEVVLFLARRDRGEQPWALVSSGVRVFSDGITHRFEQHDNPGPYVPVPQGRDPYDVFEDPRGREPLTRAAFELELRAAIERAEAIRRDLAASASPEARERLLEVIGPAWGTDDDEPYMLKSYSFFTDSATTTILEALWATGDIEVFLEGYSRERGGVGPWGLRSKPKAGRLLAKASERELPLHLRVAALRVLASDGWMREPEVNSLVPLLEDPEPAIRAAAAMVAVGEKGVTPSWRATIVERLRVESDPHARYALVEAALAHGFLTDARLPDESWPVISAQRRGRALTFRWIDPTSHWTVETLTVTALPARGEPQSLQLVPSAEADWWMSGQAQGLRRWLFFAEPLPDGRIDLELVAVLRRGEQTRRIRLDLRPLGTSASPVPVNRRVTNQPSVIEPTPVPIGCACTATESRAGNVGWSLVLAGLVGYRRRRGALLSAK